MTTEEVKSNLVEITNEVLYEVEPCFYRNSWKRKDSFRGCVLYTYTTVPIATTVVVAPGQTDEEAVAIAVERVKLYAKQVEEKERVKAEEGAAA